MSIDLSRLEAVVEASGVPGRIEALLPIGVRPRQLSVRTLSSACSAARQRAGRRT